MTSASTYTYSDELYSDFFKEAYGFRPRGEIYASWNAMTPDEKQRQWDMIGDAFDDRQRAEQAAEAAAKVRFEKRIADAIALGAQDEATAIRWVLDSEGLSDYDYAYGGSYVCYHFELPNDMAPMFEDICQERAGTYWERMNDEL